MNDHDALTFGNDLMTGFITYQNLPEIVAWGLVDGNSSVLFNNFPKILIHFCFLGLSFDSIASSFKCLRAIRANPR